MDFSESTRVVLGRIQEVEPDLASKIMGYLLLKDYSDKEMIRVAFGPDSAITSLIDEAKSALPLFFGAYTQIFATLCSTQNIQQQQQPSPVPPPLHNPCPPSSIPQCQPPLPPHNSSPNSPFSWDAKAAADQHVTAADFNPYYGGGGGGQPRLLNLSTTDEDDYCDGDLDGCPVMSLSPGPNNNGFFRSSNNQCYYYYGDDVVTTDPRTTGRRSAADFPMKACHYYYKGYCKHGANCRYFHGHCASSDAGCAPNDDNASFSPGSLEKLEMELTELLKSRGRQPISIASLPSIYSEKYGKHLQADGYLTESQRHGKAGYSLTKLLARMKNSIRLIDRPHGQHCVVLAEDAPKNLDHRNDLGGNAPSGSLQIYLTFPADSTFTEDDVANYFKQFGPVHAVRIPAQQKRMFGFVTFVHPESVRNVFAKGNPHFVCKARVLVKPYREKTRSIERKTCDRVDSSICAQYLDCYHSFQSAVPRASESSRLLRRHLIEEHEQTLEQERRRLSQLNLAQHLGLHPYLGYTAEEMRLQEDPDWLPTADNFSCQFEALSNDTARVDKLRLKSSSYNDQDCSADLPESPFASPRFGRSISSVA